MLWCIWTVWWWEFFKCNTTENFQPFIYSLFSDDVESDNPKTLYELFERAVKLSGDLPFVGEQKRIADSNSKNVDRIQYIWTTYDEVYFLFEKCKFI